MRISEIDRFDDDKDLQPIQYPNVMEKRKNSEIHQLPDGHGNYNEIQIADGILLNSEPANKWFFTETGEIASMINATYYGGDLWIFGRTIKKVKDFFEKPFQSHYINIYCSNGELTDPKLFRTSDVKFKMIGIHHKDQYIFYPMIHTIDMFLE
jgi:hypothetical protein